MMRLALLLAAAAAHLVAGHGQEPQLKAGQKPCTKKMLSNFIDCAYEKDYDPTTGQFEHPPSACMEQYNASFAACKGGFNYLAVGAWGGWWGSGCVRACMRACVCGWIGRVGRPWVIKQSIDHIIC